MHITEIFTILLTTVVVVVTIVAFMTRFLRDRESTDDQESLGKRLSRLEELTQKQSAQLGEKEIQDIRDSLMSMIATGASDELVRKAEDAIIENSGIPRVDRTFRRLLRRLESEIYNLNRRATLNLIIGTTLALVGVSILGVFVITTQTPESTVAAGIDFARRISIVILIEIFAYFFLNLYRVSLIEQKYYQNEMTNIQIKWIGLEVAKIAENDVVREIANVLAETERNFVLKKGESTVELRRQSKSDKQFRSLISELRASLGPSPKSE